MTANNTHNRETYMPLVGFEPTISAGERPQTYALDRAATGTSVGDIGLSNYLCNLISKILLSLQDVEYIYIYIYIYIYTGCPTS